MHRSSPGATLTSRSSLESTYKKSVLPGGLSIVTEEIPYLKSISVGIWIEVGSRDEDERTNGITHFIEHMVFKGTRNYSLRRIAQSLESVGGYLNAFTSKEHTCYYARALDADLALSIDVLTDLVEYPLFEAKEIEKEKQVVLEELKNIEDDPDELINDFFDESVYQRHPLGYPVIGKADNIRTFTRDDLLAHLHDQYASRRIVVAAAGNLRHENVVELIDAKMNRKRTHPAVARRATGPKSHDAVRKVYERPISQAHLCMGTLAYGVKSKNRYPLLLLNTLLGEGMSSRLFQQLRERHGLAYNVYSFTNTMSDTGNFGVYIATDPSNVERSIDLVGRELDKLKSTAVGKAELQRTKSQLKGTMMLSLESMSSRMMRLGSGEMYYRRNIPLEEVLRKIDAVTPDDIAESAGKILHMDRFATVIIVPQKGFSASFPEAVISNN